MIVLSIQVAQAQAQALVAMGYDTLQVAKANPQGAAGPFSAVSGAAGQVALAAATTSYTWLDPGGAYGDWYQVSAVRVAPAPPSLNPVVLPSPIPGYQADLLATVRDLLGVSTIEASDAQILGASYFPAALAHVRTRVPGFDATVAAGADLASLCIAALAHYTAALLCPRMTVAVVDSEVFKDYRYQRNRQMDWTATQTALLTQYELLVSQAAQETPDMVAALVENPVLVAGPASSGQDNSGLVPIAPDPYENPLAPYNPNWNPNN